MPDNTAKTTPLTDMHIRAEAKMGSFAGYQMPLFYKLGLMKEHLHTRSHAGLFDICHMVLVEVEGREASDFIERLCPYWAQEQAIGSCRYTFLLNETAGIIDDLIVTRLDDQRFLIVANAGCAEKDLAHIEHHSKSFDITVSILKRGFLALQGPRSEAVLENTGLNVADLAFMQAKEPKANWFVSRTGYTGEDGFEIALPIDETEAFAQKLLQNDQVELIGLGARDSLRLEAGLSLYGQDLDETTTPYDVGLMWAVSKQAREAGRFIGAKSLAEITSEGRTQIRIGLQPIDKVPVRSGVSLVDGEGRQIGRITSGGFGPSVDYPVALGLIIAEAKEGPFFAEVRGRKLEMKKASLPFSPHNYKRFS